VAFLFACFNAKGMRKMGINQGSNAATASNGQHSANGAQPNANGTAGAQ
jgi:hypothetical protein